MDNKVLKTKQAAEYAGISSWKLRRLARDRQVAYISDGDNTSPFRFLVADLDAYLERCRVPAKEEAGRVQ